MAVEVAAGPEMEKEERKGFRQLELGTEEVASNPELSEEMEDAASEEEMEVKQAFVQTTGRSHADEGQTGLTMAPEPEPEPEPPLEQCDVVAAHVAHAGFPSRQVSVEVGDTFSTLDVGSNGARSSAAFAGAGPSTTRFWAAPSTS